MKTSLLTIIGLFVIMASINSQAGDNWGFSISISNGHVSAGHVYRTVTPSYRHWHGSPGYYTSCDYYDCHQVRVIPRTVTYHRPQAPVIVLPRPPFFPPIVFAPPVRYSRPSYSCNRSYPRPQPRVSAHSSSRRYAHSGSDRRRADSRQSPSRRDSSRGQQTRRH